MLGGIQSKISLNDLIAPSANKPLIVEYRLSGILRRSVILTRGKNTCYIQIWNTWVAGI